MSVKAARINTRHKKRSRKKAFYKFKLYLKLFLITGLTITTFLYLGINQIVQDKKDEIVKNFSREYNLNIEYENIRINPKKGLSAYNLHIYNDQYYLVVPRLDIRIDIFQLLKDGAVRKSILEIMLNSPEFTFLENRDKKALPAAGEKTGEVVPAPAPGGAPGEFLFKKNEIRKLLRAGNDIKVSMNRGAVNFSGGSYQLPYFSFVSHVNRFGEFEYKVQYRVAKNTIILFGNIGKYFEHLTGRFKFLKNKRQFDSFEILGKLKQEKIKIYINSLSKKLSLIAEIKAKPSALTVRYLHRTLGLHYLSDFVSFFIHDASTDRVYTMLEQFGVDILSPQSLSYMRLSYQGLSNRNYRLRANSRIDNGKTGESLDVGLLHTHRRTSTQVRYRKGAGSLKLSYRSLPKHYFPRVTISVEDLVLNEATLNYSWSVRPEGDRGENALIHLTNTSVVNPDGYTLRIGRKGKDQLTLVTLGKKKALTTDLVYNLKHRKLNRLHLEFEQYPLQLAADLFGNREFRKYNLSGNVNLDYFHTYKWETTLDIHHSLNLKRVFQGSMSYNNNRLDFKKCHLTLLDKKYNLSGHIDLNKKKEPVYIAYQLPGQRGKVRGAIQANNNIIAIDFYNKKMWQNWSVVYERKSGDVTVDLDGLRLVKNSRLDFSSEISLRPKLQANGNFIIRNFLRKGKRSELIAYYGMQGNILDFKSLKYIDEDNILFGLGSVKLGTSLTYKFNLRGITGKEAVNITGITKGQNLSAIIAANNIDLDKYDVPVPFYLNGDLRLFARITGPVNSPNLRANIYLQNYWFHNQQCRLYTELYKFGETIELRNLEIFNLAGNTKKTYLATPSLKIENGKMAAELTLDDLRLFWQVSGKAFFDLDLGTMSGELSLPEYTLNDKKYKDFKTVIRREKNNIYFESPEAAGIVGTIKQAGDKQLINLALMRKRESGLEISGHISPGETELIFLSDKFKFRHLNYFDDLAIRDTGESRVFDYTYRGKTYKDINMFIVFRETREGPEINGRLRSSGQIQVTGASRISDYYDFQVTIEDNVVRTGKGDMYIQYGDEIIYLDNSSLSASDLLTVDEYDLNFLSSGTKGIPLTLDLGQLVLEGNFKDINISVTGSEFYPKITGSATLVNNDIGFNLGYRTPNMSWDELRKDFFFRADWDVDIKAAEKVRFDNPVLQCALSPGSALRYKGTPYNDDYYLSGRVGSKKGTYTHTGVDFRIRELEMNFPADEQEINPVVKFVGVVKVRDPGIDDNINIIVEKNSRLYTRGKIDTATFTFNSSPPRTQQQIKELLGFSDIEPRDKLLEASSKLMVNTYLFRPLERRLRRSLNVDLVKIDTDLVSMLRSSANPLDPDRPTFNTRLSVGKYLSDKLFFQTDFNWDNLGSSSNTFGGMMSIEYDLKLFNLEGGVKIDSFRNLGGGVKPEASFELNKNWRF